MAVVKPAAARQGINMARARGTDAKKGTRRRQMTTGFNSRFGQSNARSVYLNSYVQMLIATLIMGNFITNIVEKQIDPWNEFYSDYWRWIEFGWNCIFILELLWNIYGSFYLHTWEGHFLRSGWNIFDVLVVGVSVPSMTGADLGSFSQMRMLRAFRVFRLVCGQHTTRAHGHALLAPTAHALPARARLGAPRPLPSDVRTGGPRRASAVQADQISEQDHRIAGARGTRHRQRRHRHDPRHVYLLE